MKQASAPIPPQSAYNESQQKAIEDSRKVEGITLVQGPPGTGKTHTVLGILAVLLNSSAKERKAPPPGSLSLRGKGGAERKVALMAMFTDHGQAVWMSSCGATVERVGFAMFSKSGHPPYPVAPMSLLPTRGDSVRTRRYVS